MALPQPAGPSHAIQEANLKAALDTVTIHVETIDADGVRAVEAVEREASMLPAVQSTFMHSGTVESSGHGLPSACGCLMQESI